MGELRLQELRLKAFKSYRDAVLPLHSLTLLIGRNGSGKSNALDALEVLSRLARGEDVQDALEGQRGDGASIRGGLEGCAPHGTTTFELGVTVADAADFDTSTFWGELDVTVQVSPEPRVIAEKLAGYLPGERYRTVLETTEDVDPNRSDIFASVFNGKRGRDPVRAFRSSRLLSSQLPLRLEPGTPTEDRILALIDGVLAALSGVFHLDPVPHLMRTYVPEKDWTLRRTAANLSATIGRLQREDKAAFAQLTATVKALPEFEIQALEVGRGGFGDVMIALKEGKGRSAQVTPAREMSDGMLRMLAVSTALLGGEQLLALNSVGGHEDLPLCLVLEELENGVFPSQAARMLDLIKATSSDRGFQVLLTTHSPVLLNALSGDDHRGVVLCRRDSKSGASILTPLTELPGYLRMMAGNRLGDALANDEVQRASAPVPRTPSSIESLLGID